MPTAILSLQRLAWTIGIRVEQLRAIADATKLDHSSQYHHFVRRTGKDKIRQFDNPSPELKNVQRRILRHVLAPLGFGEAAHGGISGRSPETNAKVHQGQRCVVKMDVKSFFPSVQHKRVYRLLRHEHGFGRDVAHLLTRLATLRGGLPQGAPTSPAFGNQFARSIDERLKTSLEKHGLRYTRYIDDIAISGDRPELLINMTSRLLEAKGLRLHPEKLKVCHSDGPQEVTGLVVNQKGRLSIPRAYRDAVRSSIHKLRALPADEWPGAIASINAKIRHIERYNNGSSIRLRRYLQDVLQTE